MTTSNNITLSETDYLRILSYGTTAFELLHAALEFDLFEHLEEAGALNVEEVATIIGIKYQPARILLLGLSSLQLLEVVDGKYVNSAMVKRKLLRSSSRFLGPFVDMQSKIVNESMVDFIDSLRCNTNVGLRHINGPGDTLYERLTVSPELQKVFYANMGDVSRNTFAQFLDLYDLTAVRHLVDIGGGDGTNSIELARRYPQLKVTVFDQETVTHLASNRIQDPDLRERVRFHAGDLFTSPLPKGADAILYFHIFEIWSLERNTELLRKCHAALPDGGMCFVYNFASNNEGSGSLSAGLVSPYFLTLASGEGMVYSANDMEQAMLNAGFRQAERYENLGFSHALVVGHK